MFIGRYIQTTKPACHGWVSLIQWQNLQLFFPLSIQILEISLPHWHAYISLVTLKSHLCNVIHICSSQRYVGDVRRICIWHSFVLIIIGKFVCNTFTSQSDLLKGQFSTCHKWNRANKVISIWFKKKNKSSNDNLSFRKCSHYFVGANRCWKSTNVFYRFLLVWTKLSCI
jgi:hypothetical protein